MFWSGIVVKNSEFGTKGTIEVVLGQKFKPSANDRKFSKPIYEQSNEDIKEIIGINKSESGAMSSTCKCLVLSNLGNGESFGSFAIPQIGTKGLVAEIGDKTRFGNVYYVWLGGLYGNKQYGYNVKIPNDDTGEDIEKEKDYYETTSDTDEIDVSEYIKEGAYILKTKTNEISDYNNIDNEKINHNNILPENTFILSKSKAALRHNINDYDENKRKGLSQLLMNDDDLIIKRKIKNDNKTLEQQILINNENFIISTTNENGDTSTVIKINTDGNVEINTTGNMNVTSDGNMEFETKGDMNLKSSGKMYFEATGNMKINANGQDLGKEVDNLGQAVATLVTQGSPATQSANPTTVNKGTQVSTNVAMAFEG